MLTLIRQTLRLFAHDERRRAAVLCAAVVCSALLEVLSVAAIMPFMAVIAARDGSQGQRLLTLLRTGLPQASEQTLVLCIGALSLGLLILSAVVGVLTRYALIEFSYAQYHRLSKRLFDGYLAQPLPFFLTRNSAKLSESVIGDCEVIVSKVILSLMIVFSNAVVALGIVLAVIVIQPSLALMAVALIGGLYLLIYRFLRRLVLRIGHRRQALSGEHVSTVHQALRSIKEIKVFGAERYFIDRYTLLSKETGRANGQAVALAELPRKVIETIAIGGALAVMLFMAAHRGGIQDLMPLITLYVFATFRLLPAVQQIFQHLVKIRFYEPTVNAVVEELDRAASGGLAPAPPSDDDGARLPAGADIVFDQVTFRYDSAQAPALDQVSLRIPTGAVVALVGETGSGKSTAVSLLLGLLTPQQGQVRVGGQALNPGNARQWRRGVGYVPQAITLLDDTVARNIAFGAAAPDPTRLARAAGAAQIQAFIEERLPQGFATPVGDNGVRLSGGERQRLGIARALYRDPDMLVLDEATSALDNTTERAVVQQIHDQGPGRTVVMVAHRLNTIQQCDLIFYFDRGRLAGTGRFDQLLACCPGFAQLVASARQSDKALP